jgi:hypothetical protein
MDLGDQRHPAEYDLGAVLSGRDRKRRDDLRRCAGGHSLDTTRQIPYDNVAPPAASIIREYRALRLAGIAGKPDLVQGTGLEEIDLRHPARNRAHLGVFQRARRDQENFSRGGSSTTLMLSTEDFWFQVKGFRPKPSRKTTTSFQPGAAGKDLVCKTRLAGLARER